MILQEQGVRFGNNNNNNLILAVGAALLLVPFALYYYYYYYWQKQQQTKRHVGCSPQEIRSKRELALQRLEQQQQQTPKKKKNRESSTKKKSIPYCNDETNNNKQGADDDDAVVSKESKSKAVALPGNQKSSSTLRQRKTTTTTTTTTTPLVPVVESSHRRQGQVPYSKEEAEAEASVVHQTSPPRFKATKAALVDGVNDDVAAAGVDDDDDDGVNDDDDDDDQVTSAAPTTPVPPSLPPPQLLCQALSHVMQQVVSVQPGTGTWGGQGWKKNQKNKQQWKAAKTNSNALKDENSVLFLPLIEYDLDKQATSLKDDNDDNKNEWTKLASALQSILLLDENNNHKSNNPFVLQDGGKVWTVALASQWHGRTRTVVRDFDDFIGEDDNDKEGLKACMEIFAMGCVARRCARQIARQAKEETKDDGDDGGFVLSELFADEVAEEDQNDRLSATGGGALAELVELLSQTTTVVTKTFLSDILSSCRSDGTEAQVTNALIERGLVLLPQMKNITRAVPSNKIYRALNYWTNLLNLSPDNIAGVLRTKLEAEVVDAIASVKDGTSAREIEEASIIRNLLSLCAYTVPDAGMETAASSSRSRLVAKPRLTHFQHNLRSLENYPTFVFDRKLPQTGLDRVISEERRVMGASQTACAVVLKRIMMSGSKEGKRWLFRWVGAVARANESFVHLLETDLLSVDSAQKLCSTRQFLLGTASTLLNLSGQSLVNRFEKMGAEAFEVLYLTNPCNDSQDPESGMLGIAADERCLFSTKQSATSTQGKFSGSTEFFFLIGTLLRVSLFPSLRIQQEFLRRHGDLFARMGELASKQEDGQRIPEVILDRVRRSTDVFLGWKTFVEDPLFVTAVTNFSLLQLRWLVAVFSQDDEPKPGSRLRGPDAFAVIPEWLCKLPAQWLAHVASRHPSLMKSYQADAAVEYATQLLQVSSAVGSSLSPPVLTALIRIAGAFVSSGVQRARNKLRIKELGQKRGMRARRSLHEDIDNLEDIDERWLEIYLSFDADDLGVTVFANKYMLNNLCPTLISTFSALDAVEGMDVEREHNFDKFAVKSEVAELLLRLWSHPGGEARASIVSIDEDAVSVFASSVSAALSLDLDNTLQFIIDIRGILKGELDLSMVSLRDQRYFDIQAKRIAGGLQQARRYLLLFCQLSENERIASILGGHLNRSCVSMDLAIMFVQFLDKLTADDGGTNPELDFRRSRLPTSALFHDAGLVTTEATTDLLAARYFVYSQFGLDVSLFMHQFVALAARWHLAAVRKTKEGARHSSFLNAIVGNEDFSLKHLRSVYTRLIVAKEAKDAPEAFERDGHVDFSAWKEHFDIATNRRVRDRSQRFYSKQDLMSHAQLEHVASDKDILAFMEDLGQAAEAIRPSNSSREHEEDIKTLEHGLLEQTCHLGPEEYSDRLGEWIVSSQPFLSSSGDGRFSHTYDSVARSRSSESIGSGKIMVKEARKCHRGLPETHPNASTFICFAEERMDLCRAIITGAVDTPYSLGLFEFDVFFPAMYPNVPPLLTFKTTGGGQVRFNPNLYNDGKVCISLLGTAHAWNESQRWNAEHSSLAQVLLSIQSQILAVPDPFFNEGFGHEPMKGTQAGEEGSRRYNNSLRLATLRFAIIAYLKHPPQGFEEVSKRHFSMCRKRLLVQAHRWTLEAKGTPLEERFARAYNELVVLLSKDDIVNESESVLPPLKEDMEALDRLGFPMFADIIQEDDRKPAAKQEPVDVSPTAPVMTPERLVTENPWANMEQLGSQGVQMGTTTATTKSQATNKEIDEEDDFYS